MKRLFIYKGLELEANINGYATYDLKVATSMKDVENSDHLFVLADSDSKGARGATSMLGGKVMTLASSDFANNNWLSNNLSYNKTFTATHEFGHAIGIITFAESI